jgi:hypothetical protein
MREWLGGGKREWIKMASGGGYSDRGVNIRREENDIHAVPLFPSNTTLAFVNRSLPSDSVIRLQVCATISDRESLAGLVVRRMKALWEGMRVLRGRGIWPCSWFWTLAIDLLKESRVGLRSKSQRKGDRRKNGDVNGE